MKVPWFKFSRVPWGTVYLLEAKNMPGLFKVGYTKRKTKDRRVELNRVAGDNMKIIATVRMPWARNCEAKLLKRLRLNPFRARDKRGTEWFWLMPGESIESIISKLHKASRRTQMIAKLKLSWPLDAELRYFPPK